MKSFRAVTAGGKEDKFSPPPAAHSRSSITVVEVRDAPFVGQDMATAVPPLGKRQQRLMRVNAREHSALKRLLLFLFAGLFLLHRSSVLSRGNSPRLKLEEAVLRGAFTDRRVENRPLPPSVDDHLNPSKNGPVGRDGTIIPREARPKGQLGGLKTAF
jgi:hypothetical protein